MDVDLPGLIERLGYKQVRSAVLSRRSNQPFDLGGEPRIGHGGRRNPRGNRRRVLSG